MEVTFDSLPIVVSGLRADIHELKQLLFSASIAPQPDHWFDLDELIEYDPEKRSKPTFYRYVSHGLIPYHKRGKKLTFLKSEIDFWLAGGRVKTKSEIESELN